jgi:hypothetical protein
MRPRPQLAACPSPLYGARTTDYLFAAQMSNQVGILKEFDIFIILVRSSPASSPRLPLAQRAPASRQLARSSEAPA